MNNVIDFGLKAFATWPPNCSSFSSTPSQPIHPKPSLSMHASGHLFNDVLAHFGCLLHHLNHITQPRYHGLYLKQTHTQDTGDQTLALEWLIARTIMGNYPSIQLILRCRDESYAITTRNLIINVYTFLCASVHTKSLIRGSLQKLDLNHATHGNHSHVITLLECLSLTQLPMALVM